MVQVLATKYKEGVFVDITEKHDPSTPLSSTTHAHDPYQVPDSYIYMWKNRASIDYYIARCITLWYIAYMDDVVEVAYAQKNMGLWDNLLLVTNFKRKRCK